MLKSYFDRSGQEDQKFMTLSGIAAKDDVWAEIENNWDYILKKRSDPPAKYMHMVEAVNLRCEFSRDKGWDDEKVSGLINLLVSYVTQIEPVNYCQFYCTIDMDAYRKLQAETYQMNSPVDICNTYCVERVMRWHSSEYKSLDIQASYYFDQGEPFKPVFEAKWDREKIRDIELGTFGIWSHINHVGSMNMRETPGLQIADMLAWGSNREQNVAERFQHIALTMRSIMPTKGITWDEATLRKRFRPLIYKP